MWDWYSLYTTNQYSSTLSQYYLVWLFYFLQLNRRSFDPIDSKRIVSLHVHNLKFPFSYFHIESNLLTKENPSSSLSSFLATQSTCHSTSTHLPIWKTLRLCIPGPPGTTTLMHGLSHDIFLSWFTVFGRWLCLGVLNTNLACGVLNNTPYIFYSVEYNGIFPL